MVDIENFTKGKIRLFSFSLCGRAGPLSSKFTSECWVASLEKVCLEV